MSGNLFRHIAAVLVGGTLVASASLPPEHGHPSTPGHSAIVHRHASLHVVRASHRVSLRDDDGLIIWIDGSYLSGTKASVGFVASVALDPAVVEPPLIVRRMVLEAHGPGIHGPPRAPSGSRAPPLHLAL